MTAVYNYYYSQACTLFIPRCVAFMTIENRHFPEHKI